MRTCAGITWQTNAPLLLQAHRHLRGAGDAVKVCRAARRVFQNKPASPTRRPGSALLSSPSPGRSASRRKALPDNQQLAAPPQGNRAHAQPDQQRRRKAQPGWKGGAAARAPRGPGKPRKGHQNGGGIAAAGRGAGATAQRRRRPVSQQAGGPAVAAGGGRRLGPSSGHKLAARGR